MSENNTDFDNQIVLTSDVIAITSENTNINDINKDLSKNKKKKEDSKTIGLEVLELPKRKLPALVEELLQKDIPIRITKKGYLVGGFYGLGDNDNKGFVTVQETNDVNTLVFFDNKGHKHPIKNFDDLVKFHNFIWGTYFKLSEDYKKPDSLWFGYMLQHGVLSITPGNIR
jgi:hypothetical protein